MSNKAELIITALQQRIGEIVSTYETQIAVLRAEITQLMEKDDKKETMINEIEELIGKYEIMKQDLNILVVHNNIDILSKKFKELKQQFSNNFIVLLLKYIKKYRKVAEPNPYFITQLTDTIL